MLLRSATDHFQEIPHETWLEIGDVRERVLEVCKHVKADLLVVGTRGSTGVTKFFLGSVAERIVRSAPCPVLTIGWHVLANDASSFTDILYPTDFLPESEVALPYALSLARVNSAHLTMLHVARGKPPKNSTTFPVEAFRLDFERLIRGHDHQNVKLRFAVDFSRSVADAVHQRALELTGGLIVLGVRETPSWATRLPDVAHKIAATAPCPVLTIRSKRVVAEDWR
jgi:nucleotide-binding universal stress UspA family protein